MLKRLQVTGHLDGLRGDEIVGWAFGGGEACDIVARDASGEVIALGKASLERPDLLCLGQGRCDFAFSLPMGMKSKTAIVHVFANDMEIANSPLVIRSGQFDGAFEIKHGLIDGWVSERSEREVAPCIKIIDQDGVVVFKARAKDDQTDNSRLGSIARFSGKISQVCFGAGERCLSAFANDTKFAEARCNLTLRGNVEVLQVDRCAGWLLSTDAPARSLEIDILLNGEVVATAKCQLPRSDVQDSYPGIPKSGFSCDLPPGLNWVMQFSTVSFRFPGSHRELFDGPFVIASRPAVIDAARAVSRLGITLPPDPRSRDMQLVLQSAIQDYLSKSRATESVVFRKSFTTSHILDCGRRLSVIIPIYRNVEVTRACIESVLQCRSSITDRVILVNDFSPDSGMSAMLHTYLQQPNLVLLNNETNIGFIKSINRALSFCENEDVLLLNSDTRVFAGALDCLYRVAHASDDIGTVTAMSNNATLFSYPHYGLRQEQLDDISWQELAEEALSLNGEMAVDVPSGHGFCLLIKRSVLNRLVNLDERFGRGYGEENDFCARAADLGFRNVAAAGVIVEHRESTSFQAEKDILLAENLRRLEALYPEYTPTVIEVERRDDLRIARWTLDGARLRRASLSRSFALMVSHTLGGGTSKAIADIEELVGYGGATKLKLSCRLDGYLELECAQPLLHATFSPNDMLDLTKLLSGTNITLVIMHQVLGFPASFIPPFTAFLRKTHSVFYAHDYYAFCPRVTMIDAMDRFCSQASLDVCTRCVRLGGAHPSSRMKELGPEAHRALFGSFLSAFKHVVAPSASAAEYMQAAFPGLRVEAVPHPWKVPATLPALRSGNSEVVLLGALGAHKGSGKLLEIARLAKLTHPALHFTVVGYTDIDDHLSGLSNVSITGAFTAEDLPSIVQGIDARLALFLSNWPETYSYTLSEAVLLGFFPLVPDIGAPAERVRTSGFGAVFPFPILASDVLRLIETTSPEPSQSLLRAPWLLDQVAVKKSIARTRELFCPPRRVGRKSPAGAANRQRSVD